MRFLLAVALACGLACGNPIRLDGVSDTLHTLFSEDENRASEDQVKLDYQNMASRAHPDHDNAKYPLFSEVDSALLSKPTYSAFQALQATFTTPDANVADPDTSARDIAFGNFVDSIKSTKVFQSAWQFLQQAGKATSNYDDFKKLLSNLWITAYARNSVVGSSGFESVFVGEIDGSKVIRFNNWLSFYALEAAQKIKYHGWIEKKNNVQIELQIMWGDAEAVETSLLLDTSPEVEFMAYTVCALSGNGQCETSIEGVDVTLHVNTLTANGIVVIDECYPTASGSSPSHKTTHKGGNPTQAPSDNTGLAAVIEDMRKADTDRPTDSQYTLHWGEHVKGSSDVSHAPLFSNVDESVFSKVVYQKLINIYEKKMFTPDTCTAEPSMTGFRKQIMLDWLNTMTNTTVFQKAFAYLQKEGKANNIDDLKDKLFMLWFGTYSRCSSDKSIQGSSGWEHVFSGEWKGETVDGHHNWINYYRQEKAGDIKYHGYFSYDKQLTGTFQYQWDKAFKREGGFLIGTTPAFDFSVLSICVLTHPNGKNCKFTIDGFPIGVVSYTQACDAGTCIATAYPTD